MKAWAVKWKDRPLENQLPFLSVIYADCGEAAKGFDGVEIVPVEITEITEEEGK